METNIKEELLKDDYRLQYTTTITGNDFLRLELCVRNTEMEREEEMRIYGYIGFEHETYTCNLSAGVDIIAIFEAFDEYLSKIRAQYSTER